MSVDDEIVKAVDCAVIDLEGVVILSVHSKGPVRGAAVARQSFSVEVDLERP